MEQTDSHKEPFKQQQHQKSDQKIYPALATDVAAKDVKKDLALQGATNVLQDMKDALEDHSKHVAELGLPSDVRVAVLGTVDHGKSTLIGVLTGGELDNGRGLSRSRVFVHPHEQANGRTSCVAHHILGFTGALQPVHMPKSGASAVANSKTKGWRSIVENSKHLVTFIDLAGHSRYLKTTIYGLCSCRPHYALIMVNALAGVSKMTREHLGVVLALNIPFACVVSKIDLAPANVLERNLQQLIRLLKSAQVKKMPIVVREEKDIKLCTENAESKRVAPIFVISAVNGKGIPLLTHFLAHLSSSSSSSQASAPVSQSGAVEFELDEKWQVPGVGLCVSGLVSRGTLVENSVLKLGPESDGSFREVVVKTIQYKRMPVNHCPAGKTCAVNIRLHKRKDGTLKRSALRHGMILTSTEEKLLPVQEFSAEVRVLHHPTTIKEGYQAVIHCNSVTQSAVIVKIEQASKSADSKSAPAECLRTGDVAQVKFRFLQRPEILRPGDIFLAREGSTKCIGKITPSQSIINPPPPAPAIASAADEKKGEETKDANSLVNVDVTALIFLVSDLTNLELTSDKLATYPAGTQAFDNAEAELKERSLPRVLEYLKDKKLVMCRTAYEQSRQLVDVLANDAERKRAPQWFDRITVVEDQPSDFSKLLLKQLSAKIKEPNVVTFGTADKFGIPTITSNVSFIRCAAERGLTFKTFLHPARPLSCLGKKQRSSCK